MERRRRQLRCRRQLAAKRTHRCVGDGRRLGIDIGAEDEPVVGQQQQCVDVLGFERLPSGSERRHHSQANIGVVERLRCAPESYGEAGRRRRRDCDPVGRLLIGQPGERG